MFEKELENIGKRIQELREEKKWTQEMLAEKLNIARNTLTKLEGGFRDFKSTEIIKIAKVLGVSTDYLLGLTVIKKPDVSEREVSQRYGFCEEALYALSLNGNGVEKDQDMYKDTLKFRLVINRLLTDEHGREALRMLASCFLMYPVLKQGSQYAFYMNEQETYYPIDGKAFRKALYICVVDELSEILLFTEEDEIS